MSKLFSLARLLWHGNRSVTNHVFHFSAIDSFEVQWETSNFAFHLKVIMDLRKVVVRFDLGGYLVTAGWSEAILSWTKIFVHHGSFPSLISLGRRS